MSASLPLYPTTVSSQTNTFQVRSVNAGVIQRSWRARTTRLDVPDKSIELLPCSLCPNRQINMHRFKITVAIACCLKLCVAAIDKVWTQQWMMATIYAIGCFDGMEFIRQTTPQQCDCGKMKRLRVPKSIPAIQCSSLIGGVVRLSKTNHSASWITMR